MTLHYYRVVNQIEKAEVATMNVESTYQVMPFPAEEILSSDEQLMISRETTGGDVYAFGLRRRPGTLTQEAVDEIDSEFQTHYGKSLTEFDVSIDGIDNLYDYLNIYTKSYRPGHESYRPPFDMKQELLGLREGVGKKLTTAIEERVNQ